MRGSTGDDVLTDVFDGFLHGPSLFSNRDVMRPDYIPSRLPHRENQIKKLGHILVPVLKKDRCSNLFVYGKTGTGKTAVVKYVLKRLFRKCQEISIPFRTCYVNCRIVGTDYRVLSALCDAVGIRVPFTGLATAEVFNRFRAAIDSENVLLLAALDEIDALIKSKGDDLLYELTRVNEDLEGAKLSLIGISNDLHFKEFLDPSVLSSLSEEEVVFRPYTAPELEDILRERAEAAFFKGVLADGTLGLCAALAASEHGDARRALDLLRVAGELAERAGEGCVTEDHVRQAQEKIENDRVLEVLKTLPLHSKLVLCSVYCLKGAASKGSFTGDVFEVYKVLCSQVGVDPLTQRRVSGLISELDVVGLLNASLVNLGRYGRTKRIQIGIPSKIIVTAFNGDTWVSPLLDYVPSGLQGK